MTRWIALLVGMCVSVSATAQPLADRVPQDALIYVGWSGSQSPGPGYDKSRLKSVIEASQIAALFKESLPKFIENLGHQTQDVAELMQLLNTVGGPMWRHPSAFYFGGLDFTNPDFPMPRIAVICQAGDEAKALVEEVTQLMKKAGQPPVPFRAEEKDGLVVVVLGNAEISPAKKPVVALNQKKEFIKAMAQVGKDPVAAIYIDTEGFVEQVDNVIATYAPGDVRANWAKIRDHTGISSIKRIAWTGGFDDKDWSSRIFLEAPEPRVGFAKWLIDSKPLPDGMLALVPAGATSVSAGHLDAGGLLMEIRSFIKKFNPNESAEFENHLEQIKSFIGLDVQTDLLDAMGDEWALYTDPNIGGSGVLGLVVINKVKDPAKLEKSMLRLQELANKTIQENRVEKFTVEFRSQMHKETRIHYLAVPLVAPAWAIKDGNLYIGLYPQVVAGAMDHVSGKGKSILENADFVALRKRLGGAAATGVQFADLPKTTAEGYQEVLLISRMWLGMVDLFGGKTPALVLPPLGKLLPHVVPAGAVSWTDKDGWHSSAISPFPGGDVLSMGGLGTLVAGAQAMSVGAMIPEIQRAKVMAARLRSGGNLRQIGQAMMIHANDNKGNFPKTLGELVLTQGLAAETFYNPEKRTPIPATKDRDELAATVNKTTDFVYLAAGKKDPAGADAILAHDKIVEEGGMINVLFGDGRVESITVARLRELLAKQNQ